MLDFDDHEIYELILKISIPLGVDPSSSMESENFFRDLIKKFEGEYDEVRINAWLKQQILNQFLAIHDRPRWIQNPEWPFSNNKPMVFAHQIDLSVKDSIVAKLFHDDTSLYVFLGRQHSPIVIMQQF